MNIKKISLIFLIITAGFFLVGYGFYFYTKSQKITEPNEIKTSLGETPNDSVSESSIRKDVLNIINGDTGKMVLYDYSLSPNKGYVYTTIRTPRGDVYYSLLDLKNKKDLFDSYTVAGDGELNANNHIWTNDNKLILISNFGAEGGEGFPGILVVNLIDQTFYRLVDMTGVCPSNEINNCTNAYSFDIKSVTSKSVTYGVDFNSTSIGYDPSFSYYKEETISLR